MQEYFTVPRDNAGLELDEYLCLIFPGLNKGFLRRMVYEGRVLLDGQQALPSKRLRTNQLLIVDLPEEGLQPRVPVAPEAELPILYEDESVLLLDKPPGIAVEPERWARDAACVSGALLALSLERRGEDVEAGTPLPFRPRLVHRIDKDTSGCLLAAKSLEAERVLRQAFDAGLMDKRYLALVEGDFPGEVGDDGEWTRIEAPIGPDGSRSGRMQVGGKKAKAARTDVRPRQCFRGYTLVECRLFTGRTHQIRVHLSERGFPLVVDPLYGRRDILKLSDFKRGYRVKRGRPERALLERLSLHAWRIGVPLPISEQPGNQGPEPVLTHFESPLPVDLEKALKQLARWRPVRGMER